MHSPFLHGTMSKIFEIAYAITLLTPSSLFLVQTSKGVGKSAAIEWASNAQEIAPHRTRVNISLTNTSFMNCVCSIDSDSRSGLKIIPCYAKTEHCTGKKIGYSDSRTPVVVAGSILPEIASQFTARKLDFATLTLVWSTRSMLELLLNYWVSPENLLH